MRVNLISTHRNQTGLAQDVDILQGVWALADDTVKFRRIHYNQPECHEAVNKARETRQRQQRAIGQFVHAERTGVGAREQQQHLVLGERDAVLGLHLIIEGAHE